MTTSARDRTPFGQFELHPSHLKTGRRPPTSDALRTQLSGCDPNRLPADYLPPTGLRNARMTAAVNAHDATDLAHLLDALGLRR